MTDLGALLYFGKLIIYDIIIFLLLNLCAGIIAYHYSRSYWYLVYPNLAKILVIGITVCLAAAFISGISYKGLLLSALMANVLLHEPRWRFIINISYWIIWVCRKGWREFFGDYFRYIAVYIIICTSYFVLRYVLGVIVTFNIMGMYNLIIFIILMYFISLELILLILIIIRGGSIRIRIDQLNLSNFTVALISLLPLIIILILLYILL